MRTMGRQITCRGWQMREVRQVREARQVREREVKMARVGSEQDAPKSA